MSPSGGVPLLPPRGGRLQQGRSKFLTCEASAMLTVEPHPLLDLRAFTTTFPRPLGEFATPPAVLALLDAAAPAPVRADDAMREAVRALLRHGGFRPAGRSKPASEYLTKAAADGRLGP